MKSLVLLHKSSSSSKHVLIFVHGFMGGAGTFCNKKKHFYSFLDKKILSKCDIYEFRYYTGLFDFGNIKRALSKLGVGTLFGSKYSVDLHKYSQLLETHYSYFNSDNKTVNILCHSMGGLISKHFISEIIKKESYYNGFYISFATPHRGVSEAKVLSLLNNCHIDSMEPFSSFIESSTQDWAKLSTKVKRKYYCATHDIIVNDKSACPIDDTKYLVRVEGTHETMVKPSSQDSTIIKSVNSTIINFLNFDNDKSVPTVTSTSVEDVLFYAYKKELEHYYLERKADKLIQRLLRGNNLWISGKSGTGKTNLVQRYLANSSYIFFNFDMSPCPSEASSMDILSNIYWSLSNQLEENYDLPKKPNGEQTWINYLSDLLCVIPNGKTVFLFIDELHISDVVIFEDFIDNITTLLSYHKNRQDSSGNIRIIVSTILNPLACETLRFKSKYFALFSNYTLDSWDDSEIDKLFELILINIAIKVSEVQKDKIISAANGSPRRLKFILRHFWNYGSVDKAISEVVTEGIC